MKLQRALKESIPDLSEPMRLEDFEACTYLDWTIKEMLRLHPTLPSVLERVVPPQGAVVAGHALQKGSIVAMSAFVQHSQESIFPDPEKFEPERYVFNLIAPQAAFSTLTYRLMFVTGGPMKLKR